MRYGGAQRVRVQPFFIQHHVRLYYPAAAAYGHVGHILQLLHGVAFAAFHAVVTVYAAVQLIYVPAARKLMQPIYILRNNGGQPAYAFKLCKRVMRTVGLYARNHQRAPVILIEYVRMAHKERVAEQFLRRVAEAAYGLEIAVLAAEIRYSAFGGYARPAKEGYSFAAHNHILKRFYLRCNVHRSASCALNELNHYTRLVPI